MAKYNEQTLTNWTKPTSDSEQTKLENSERMVRETINEDEKLKKISTETFGQGSYANDTNVRLNSDIDINVRYTGGFYFDLPENTTEADIGIDKLPSAGYTFKEFKDDVGRNIGNIGTLPIFFLKDCPQRQTTEYLSASTDQTSLKIKT